MQSSFEKTHKNIVRAWIGMAVVSMLMIFGFSAAIGYVVYSYLDAGEVVELACRNESAQNKKFTYTDTKNPLLGEAYCIAEVEGKRTYYTTSDDGKLYKLETKPDTLF